MKSSSVFQAKSINGISFLIQPKTNFVPFYALPVSSNRVTELQNAGYDCIKLGLHTWVFPMVKDAVCHVSATDMVTGQEVMVPLFDDETIQEMYNLIHFTI